MKKRLTLLRHAKSSWNDPKLPDRDRPLNERGEHDAPMMAQRLRSLGVRPSLILTSTALRAMQTARLIARGIGYPLEFLQREADLYLASPEEILEVLARQEDSFNDILLCGHNPGITELARRLADDKIDHMPTCAFAVLEVKLRSWSELNEGRCALKSFESPKGGSETTQD